jgi:hypothetical protein
MRSYSYTTIILLSVWLAWMAILQGSGFAQGTPKDNLEEVQLLFVQNSTGVGSTKPNAP